MNSIPTLKTCSPEIIYVILPEIADLIELSKTVKTASEKSNLLLEMARKVEEHHLFDGRC